jgi:agmatine/peptidylarginine deiminase
MSRIWACVVAISTLVVVANQGLAGESADVVRAQGHGVRVAAEWDPVTGVLIGWPLRLPKALVAEMAKDVDLFVMVKNGAVKQKARRVLAAWGIEPKRLHFVIANQGDGYYLTRDWGPFAVFDGQGNSRLVDGRYLDYPVVRVDGDEPLTYLSEVFGLDYRPDDRAPAAVAAVLGMTRTELPVALTGGNLLFDGLGTGFATQILVDENLAMGVPKDRLLQTLRKELGIVRFHVVPNFEGAEAGIQHVDCLLKLLDEERILIKRAPSDHPDFRHIEDAVLHVAKLTNPYGRPYTLLRIDTPRYDNDDLANYTNSIILNRKIYVPMFNIPGDRQALRTWRAAMPGYDVIGFALEVEDFDLRYMDAFHCRARAVWDQKMLHIAHKRILSCVPSPSGVSVTANIRDYSGAGLIDDRLRLAWRARGTPKWAEVLMKPAGPEQAFSATIEGLRPGQTVEYYLSAASRSGRAESLPRTAPKGWYTFSVLPNP